MNTGVACEPDASLAILAPPWTLIAYVSEFAGEALATISASGSPAA